MQFARAKEAEGRFLDAAAAFERGGDVDAAVRLHLHKLSNPAKAYALARASSSPTAAAAVAKAALQESLWPVAVEFLVRSGEAAEAWQVAQIHGAVDAFAAALPADAPQAVRAKVAQHYQGHELHSKAAEQFRLAGSLQACIGELVAAAGKASTIPRVPHTDSINRDRVSLSVAPTPCRLKVRRSGTRPPLARSSSSLRPPRTKRAGWRERCSRVWARPTRAAARSSWWTSIWRLGTAPRRRPRPPCLR